MKTVKPMAFIIHADDVNGAKLTALPPVPRGYVRFLASDRTIHDVPREHLTWARRIDPQLVVIAQSRPRFRRNAF